MDVGQLPERWIFGFRRTGRRTLTEEENGAFRGLAAGHGGRRTRWLWGVAVCCLAVVVGLAVVAVYSPFGWVLFAAGLIGITPVSGNAYRHGYQALLFRRACRIGAVDVYAREERPPATDGVDVPSRGVWAVEERFEEQIAKQAGRTPAGFETPADDAVLITVDGTAVSEVIDTGKEPPYCEEEA